MERSRVSPVVSVALASSTVPLVLARAHGPAGMPGIDLDFSTLTSVAPTDAFALLSLVGVGFEALCARAEPESTQASAAANAGGARG